MQMTGNFMDAGKGERKTTQAGLIVTRYSSKWGDQILTIKFVPSTMIMTQDTDTVTQEFMHNLVFTFHTPGKK
jgi:hypothetical protein